LQWTDPQTGEMSSGYKQNGYLPDAVINMLAFLGWNPGGTKEIYTLEELVKAFTIERISHGGAKFDAEKAKWFNHEYIKSKSNVELALLLQPIIENAFGDFDLSYISLACNLIKDRMVLLNDILSFEYVFNSPQKYDEANLAKVAVVKGLLDIDELEASLNSITNFSATEIEAIFKEFATKNQLKVGELMKFLRVSLVGELSGPSIPELIVLIGKETTIVRIRNCFQKL
jgi:glutamyl-tRNA synthetase